MKAVSGKDFCKVLEHSGWTFDRTKGSHHIYKKAGVIWSISVPVHGNSDLKTGLLSAMLKLAELTEADL